MFDDRWNDSYEIENSLLPYGGAAGGPMLHVRGGKPYCYAGESSIIFSGVPGAGKTRSGTIPLILSLLQSRESLVVIDIKGEDFRETYRYIPESYAGHVYKFDFRNPQEAERCDALSYIRYLYCQNTAESRELAYTLLDDFAHGVCIPNMNTDPFWSQAAADLFIGAALFLLEYAEPEQVTVENVFHFVISGARCVTGEDSALKLLVNKMPDGDNGWKMLLETYANGCSSTSKGIQQVFTTAFSPFIRLPGMRTMADNTFHIQDLDPEKPSVLYMILPDERQGAYSTWAIQLLNQLACFYRAKAEDVYEGRLPVRCNFIIEEAGNLPPLPCLPTLLNAGRSRNIRVALSVQSLSQLDAGYGADVAKSIKNAACVQVAFRSNDMSTCNELSELCGSRWAPSAGGTPIAERLLTPSMVHCLPKRTAVCLYDDYKAVSRLPDFTEFFCPARCLHSCLYPGPCTGNPARRLRHCRPDKILAFSPAL